MTERNKIIYWTSTIWLALGMLSSGTLQLFKVQAKPGKQDALAEGGYTVIVGVPDPLRVRIQRRSQ